MDPISVLLSVVVCIFLFNVFYGGKRESQNFPPGPKPLPLIGNLHMMNMKKPYLTFMELSKKYGSVFSVQLGMKKAVVLCGTDAVKDALINHADEFSGRAKIPIFHQASKGFGIVFADGENWRVMRRFAISTLRDFGMGKKTIEDRISEESDCLVESPMKVGGKPFDNTLIMNAAVANIIVHILLNQRFDYQDPTLLKLIKSISENVRISGRPIVMLYNTYPSIMQWLPGGHQTVFENTQKLFNFLKETFTKRRDQLDVNDQRDLIDAFLVKQQETTSTTLRWGLLLMMKHPDIQKKVQDEINQVIGSAEPRLDHRKQMPYTDAVIHEIQRFANLVPNGLPHATTKDVTFRGYFIPKPEEFYPEHFLDSEGHFVKNEAFLPFSAGRRICAGETLAKMELFLFFTKLLQNFTFQPPLGVEVQLTCAEAITSIPTDHKICALPRN
ncbi:hypothetical protein XELAEV_18030171mg [Xenopus laevis]|uniref:Uncharacterized protein n=1 Tax=Xenopus laevis TaxID=8355 RepID=A0A974CT25_XENLA|nr:hypothetical protein XELAEV_18030171mg [Xenopus laevis]